MVALSSSENITSKSHPEGESDILVDDQEVKGFNACPRDEPVGEEYPYSEAPSYEHAVRISGRHFWLRPPHSGR